MQRFINYWNDANLTDYRLVETEYIEKLIENTEINKANKISDWGCGPAGVSTCLANKFGVIIDGYDINKEMIAEGNLAVQQENLSHLITLHQENI